MLTEKTAGSDPLFDPLRARLNKGLMVQWINADLLNRADCDVRESIVLYDEAGVFFNALSTKITPEFFRQRIDAVQPAMEAVGVRYWSVGIV